MKTSISILLLLCLVVDGRGQEKEQVKIGLYADGGTSASKETVLKALATFNEYKVDTIKADDIRDGKLKDYRILIVPGGSGSREAKTLGEKGRDQIKSYVRDGGNYVGICAGSYLATTDYEWSIGLLNAKVVDREHWARGHGSVSIEFTDRGKSLLGVKDGKADIIYWQGPLLAPGDSKEVAPFEALARYETEIAEKGAPKGVMKGTVAVAAGKYGKGKVVCFGPHPEKMESSYNLLKGALQWVKEPEKMPASER
jgi:glutamine amidotransferase-like uncharacterized protein